VGGPWDGQTAMVEPVHYGIPGGPRILFDDESFELGRTIASYAPRGSDDNGVEVWVDTWVAASQETAKQSPPKEV
jgi:hypothetical protein